MDALKSRLILWTGRRNKNPFQIRGNAHIRYIKECRRVQLERKLVRRLLRPLFLEESHVNWVIRYLGMGTIYFTQYAKAKAMIQIPRLIQSDTAEEKLPGKNL